MGGRRHPEPPLFNHAGPFPFPAGAIDLLAVDKVARDSTLCSLHRETFVLWEMLQLCFSKEVIEIGIATCKAVLLTYPGLCASRDYAQGSTVL